MSEEGVIEDDENRRGPASLRPFPHGKKVSNEDWKSPVDNDAHREAEGHAPAGYKAEHGRSGFSSYFRRRWLAPNRIRRRDAVIDARENLQRAGSDAVIAEVAADKGYHANAQLAGCDELG